MSQVSDNQITSEEEYRNIFEAAGDRLVIYDIGLDSVVEANPAACQMHGYTRQEFIGLNPAVFMLPESHVLFRLSVSSSTIKSHVSNTLSKLGIASRLLP